MEELYLEHHGILGQKWGVRRYQNKDGSLTSEGKNHVKKLNYFERGKYDYKKSDRYKNSTRAEKNKITQEYNTNYVRFNKRTANRIQYKADLKNTSARKEGNKYMVKATIGTITLSVAKQAMKASIELGKAAVEANNIAVDMYSYQQGGLNEVKGRPTTGAKAVARGSKAVSKILKSYNRGR